MAHPEEPVEAAETRRDEPADQGRKPGDFVGVPLLGNEVEAPINAAVQESDLDERQEAEGG